MMEENGNDDQDILFSKEIYSDNEFSVTVEVAQAVARVSDRNILELDPLYTYLDSDALEDLLETDSYIDITFNYEGYQVNVEGESVLEITIMDE